MEEVGIIDDFAWNGFEILNKTVVVSSKKKLPSVEESPLSISHYFSGKLASVNMTFYLQVKKEIQKKNN